MTKFLFQMESVGEKNWKNRFKIVKNYFQKEDDPFVEKNQSCGYSVANFSFMLDVWNRGK